MKNIISQMLEFLRKHYLLIIILFLGGILFYDNHLRKEFKNTYKEKGIYTIGKINDIKGYGRGTGFNFIYNFSVSGKKYKSYCDIYPLKYGEAEKKLHKSYLVIYLNDNVYNNRLYSNILVNDSMTSSQLQKWINSNPEIKSKLDTIPHPSFFFENYF
ncbi:hypothetical protein AAEU33_20620 [Chryseobacterium sp. Chry.R1]|uniref:hypothetical protein n=1 Tax=Chryseobacterium sp. Chry.R1 TaxID=3139392 RepID=UPI0031F7D805